MIGAVAEYAMVTANAMSYRCWRMMQVDEQMSQTERRVYRWGYCLHSGRLANDCHCQLCASYITGTVLTFWADRVLSRCYSRIFW